MNSSVCADVGGAAVDQLGRQRRGLERVLAALRLLVGAGRDAGLHLGDDLVEQQRGLRLVVALGRAEPLAERLRRDLRDDRAHRRGAEHLLGLALELRLGQADRQHGGQAGQHVVLLELVVADLEPARVLLDLRAQELEQPLLEAGLVGAALRRGDDVDEAAERGVVAGAPAQRDVDLADSRSVRSPPCAPLSWSTGTVSVKCPRPGSARCR